MTRLLHKPARLLRALMLGVALAWASLAGPVLASQSTLVTPGSPLPMTSLASFLNSAFLSVGSCNSGTSAPANGTGGAAFAGECWINTTANPWVFNYSPDGTHWVAFGTLNTSTLVWTTYSVTIGATTVSGGTAGDVLGITNSGCSGSTPCMANVAGHGDRAR